MNFQTSLPYAADSGLHVIEGLDVTGMPIYQRTGLDRRLPVDMYTLLQGIIERCLATQQPGGDYLVSPTIFDETMFSTTEHYSYKSISTWIERTYPGGELSEVTGYVKNLMDMYPQNLILQAIDDKLWKLGNCSSGTYETQSVYGNLMDTPPYFQAFRDITYAMTQAGVGFSYDSFEMVLIPARASGTGADVYGAPSSAVRIYPEMLIARYKVMQQLRYKRAIIYDTRSNNSYTPGNQYSSDPERVVYGPPWITQEKIEWCYNSSAEDIKNDFTEGTPGALENLSAMTPSGLETWWTMTGSLYWPWGVTVWYTYFVALYELTLRAPRFKTKSYSGIPHDLYIWGWLTGDPTILGLSMAATLVVGKNLILQKAMSGEYTFTMGTDWGSRNWPPSVQNPWNWPGGPWYRRCSLLLYDPIEDWKFEFCKHSDFGGDVTWHV